MPVPRWSLVLLGRYPLLLWASIVCLNTQCRIAQRLAARVPPQYTLMHSQVALHIGHRTRKLHLQMRHAKPNQLWYALKSPLGHLLLQCKATPTQLHLYSRAQKKDPALATTIAQWRDLLSYPLLYTLWYATLPQGFRILRHDHTPTTQMRTYLIGSVYATYHIHRKTQRIHHIHLQAPQVHINLYYTHEPQQPGPFTTLHVQSHCTQHMEETYTHNFTLTLKRIVHPSRLFLPDPA